MRGPVREPRGGISGHPSGRGTARRWGEAVWLDRQIRVHLPGCADGEDELLNQLYDESVKYAALMRLNPEKLPATPDEFEVWAEASLKVCSVTSFRQMALDSLIGLAPLFWPVNIALACFLLPGEFWEISGKTLKDDGRRLVSAVQGVISEMGS